MNKIIKTALKIIFGGDYMMTIVDGAFAYAVIVVVFLISTELHTDSISFGLELNQQLKKYI